MALADVCPYKECSCSTTAIFCENKGLQVVPELVTKNPTIYTALLLDDNQITTIPASSLPPSLTQLSLLENPIMSIADDAFNCSTTTLTVLAFSKPRFTRIPDALIHLQNLQELNVKDVGNMDWNVGVLKQIGSTLNILYLENVNFTSPPTWLQYLTRATELNIVSSNLISLPDTALDNMADTLQTIFFTSNRLSEVPKALSKLTRLKYLDLSNNRVSSTKWLPVSSHVTSLMLIGNRIYNSSELSYSIRGYGESLIDFIIEENALVSVPDLSFLENMRSLSLKENRISDYSSGALPSNLFALDLENNLLRTIPVGMPGLDIVNTIILKSNRIAEIQGTDFPPKATVVILGFNLITTLNDNSFPENAIIESLNLDNNPISTISPGAFENLGLLEELSLQGTKLTRLPLALSSLVGLTSLDVTDTAGLICTCEESSLAAWMLSPKVDSVLGNCGQIRVYDFFTLLSPGCPR
ncbi:hypothetical protein BsWGS_23856 [Bradybaena similaris]